MTVQKTLAILRKAQIQTVAVRDFKGHGVCVQESPCGAPEMALITVRWNSPQRANPNTLLLAAAKALRAAGVQPVLYRKDARYHLAAQDAGQKPHFENLVTIEELEEELA